MRALQQVMAGTPLSREESKQLFSCLVAGELTNAQIAAMLIAMKVRGETSAEIAGAASALLDHSKPFPETSYPIADTCGTGGDGANTINISTAAALVAASMGLAVAKHGNRSVSSRSGSADVLETLGVPLDCSPDENKALLDNHKFCFLFAPHYHPGVRHAMPVRQELKTRTLFNLLGPLINPARPDAQLLGVYDPALCMPLAETLRMLGCPRAMVVHGSGLDELALHGETQVCEVNGEDIERYTLKPADFGLQSAPIEALKGGDANLNARLMQSTFAGKGESAHRDAIAMNVAALLYMTGQEDSLLNATERTLQHLSTGAAADHLKGLQQALRGAQ